MAGENKTVDQVLSEFYEAMERTNAEKIAHETLAGIYEDSSDTEDFDAESENEGVVTFLLCGLEGSNVPLPEADEVVVYRSFMKAGLQFPLDSMLVEVLKTFKVYLHQLTPKPSSR
jgi:hypothetical protein